MTDLNKYNAAYIKALNEQLAVYTTIGTPYIESPMWFIYKEYTKDDCLRFQSSQVSYMFFSLPVDKEDRNLQYEAYNFIYDHFREIKYKHIKENWPSVYYEIRPNEKPKEVKKVAPVIAQLIEDFNNIPDYQKQANDFLKATETTFTSTYKTHDFYFPDDKDTRDIYIIVLKNKQHRYRFTFGQSIANTGQHPTAYDVLACLQKYDVGNFENFCGDFGYDTDSRAAYKMYKAVLKEWKNIERLFTPDQLELLQEIN